MSGIAAANGVATEERSYFVAIATNGHGAPAAAVRARIIVEEELACGIGATTHWRVGAFDEKFRCGARDGGKEPFEATFKGDEFQAPTFSARNKFVVSFGKTQQIVDGFDPSFRERLLLDEGSEDGTEGFAEAQDFEENSVDSLRLGSRKGIKARGALGSDYAGIDEERNEFVPGEIVCSRRGVSEIKREASGDEVRAEIGGRVGHRFNWFRL